MTGSRSLLAHRGLIVGALAVSLAAVLWLYFDSYLSMVRKWSDDAAFSHGFLILPVSLWLAWQQRVPLASTAFAPTWFGAFVLVMSVVLWVVARATGVLVLQQLAVVAMIPAMVVTLLGVRAGRCLAFPLAFLVFAVPFGRALVPTLMQGTAEMATWALRFSQIPVYRSSMLISIPAGDFEVAEACSGLNYSVTALALGALYAHVVYSSKVKRAICLLAFIIVPILANGLRVYLTIALAHLTDGRFGPGHEHVILGRILFGAVMLAMFWLGLRWQDSTRRDAQPAAGPFSPALPWRLAPAVLGVLAVFSGPSLLQTGVAHVNEQLGLAKDAVRLPTGLRPWSGPVSQSPAWKPSYSGALVELAGRYERGSWPPIDVFVGIYGIGTTAGSEMISATNRIGAGAAGSFDNAVSIEVDVAGDSPLQVHEQVIRDAVADRLVWHWFVVGDRPSASAMNVKAREALAFVTRTAYSERIVVISTPVDESARRRLEEFTLQLGRCLNADRNDRSCVGP